MPEHFKTDDEIRSLVEAFEACTIHPAEFRHYQHLTVALWYVCSLPNEAAVAKMTTGIQRLAQAYGKMGYHETITLFWLRIVSEFAIKSNDPLTAATNLMIEKYDNKDYILEYYSSELLASDKAKAEWVEPDLKPLAQLSEIPSRAI
jgi:hypothetical protein